MSVRCILCALWQVLCATVDDEPRFRKQIELWIAKHEVPSFPAFMGETQAKRRLRKRKHEQEAKEAEKALKNLGHGASKFVSQWWNPLGVQSVRITPGTFSTLL